VNESPVVNLSAEEQSRTVVSTRVIDAAITDVFDAYANPEKLVRWWGPHGFTLTTESIDLNEGGHWRFVFHGPDDRDYKNHIVFSTIDAPHRFAIDHVSGPYYQMIVTFEVVDDDKTRVTMYQTFKEANVFNKIKDIVIAGNEGNLDRLTEVIAGRR
jgi:uncharacterized protein YndB with AHSA1/START domain